MALGPCGCEDYHLADCPLLTGEPQDAPEPEEWDALFSREDFESSDPAEIEYDFLRDDVDLEGQDLLDD